MVWTLFVRYGLVRTNYYYCASHPEAASHHKAVARCLGRFLRSPQGSPSGCGWLHIPGALQVERGKHSRKKLLRSINKEKIIGHRACNPASNTDQPKRVYSVAYKRSSRTGDSSLSRVPRRCSLEPCGIVASRRRLGSKATYYLPLAPVAVDTVVGRTLPCHRPWTASDEFTDMKPLTTAKK